LEVLKKKRWIFLRFEIIKIDKGFCSSSFELHRCTSCVPMDHFLQGYEKSACFFHLFLILTEQHIFDLSKKTFRNKLYLLRTFYELFYKHWLNSPSCTIFLKGIRWEFFFLFVSYLGRIVNFSVFEKLYTKNCSIDMCKIAFYLV